MDSDLMGSSGLKITSNQADLLAKKAPCFEHRHVGNGFFSPALRQDSHFLAIPGITAKPGADQTCLWPSPDQGEITPFHGSSLQLADQIDLGGDGFGRHHQATGFPVQPMDNPGPRHLGGLGGMKKKSIGQCPIRMAGCGVHHQARRLIHHNDVLILKHDR